MSERNENYSFRETSQGLVLQSHLPLREGNFATTYAIDGHKWLMSEVQGWPERVVDLVIYMHLQAQHQFGHPIPNWEDVNQESWLAAVEESDPPHFHEKEKIADEDTA